MRPLRRRMQLIFQDPMASLNPRHTIRRIVTEPMLFHGVATRPRPTPKSRARAIFDRFSLPAACLDRYPHELSGGQRQRVGIARAALLAPDFVLADEIVSGLDVSTQAQVLNLLGGLSRDLGLAMAFISHDLSVIRAVCDRVYVFAHGEIVEEGPCDERLRRADSTPTRARCIDAIPSSAVSPDWLRRDTAAEVAARQGGAKQRLRGQEGVSMRQSILCTVSAAFARRFRLGDRRTADGLPGMRGHDHTGITVPDMMQAVDFFVDVLGCKKAMSFGPFSDEPRAPS